MGTPDLNDAISDLRAYASDLVDQAPQLDVEGLHLVDGARVPRRPHRFTVPALALMSIAAMLMVAEVSVAFVANRAVPGDQTYGIDLLVEDTLIAIGVPLDTSPERIDEAEVLLARNDLSRAVSTARVGYQEMDAVIAGGTVLHLVEVERVLATSSDTEIEEGIRASFSDLLAVTKADQALEIGSTRSINAAALRVARAASGNGETQ